MMLQRRYRLERLIGAGTTSEVWQGHDELLRRQVAVRLLRADRAALAEQFLTEGAAAARLTHANVAAVYDVGTVELPDRGAVPYVVMEFVDGPTLADQLRHGPLTADEVAQIGAEVGAALAHAHGQWVTHGALTPAKVALTDVGAKVFGFTDRRGTDPHDVSPDVYALGALLHAALTTPADPRPLDVLARADLAALIERCLGPDPVLRPGSDEAALAFARIAGTRVDLPAWYTMSTGATNDPSSNPQSPARLSAARLSAARLSAARSSAARLSAAGLSAVRLSGVRPFSARRPSVLPYRDDAPGVPSRRARRSQSAGSQPSGSAELFGSTAPVSSEPAAPWFSPSAGAGFSESSAPSESAGTFGSPGSSGSSAASGLAGTFGSPGSAGSAGSAGSSGSVGSSGLSGFSGSASSGSASSGSAGSGSAGSGSLESWRSAGAGLSGSAGVARSSGFAGLAGSFGSGAPRPWVRPATQFGARSAAHTRVVLGRLPFGAQSRGGGLSRSGAALNDVTLVDLRSARAARPPAPATPAVSPGRRWAIRAVVGSIVAGIVTLATVAVLGQPQAEGTPPSSGTLQTATAAASAVPAATTEAPAPPAPAVTTPPRTQPTTRPSTTRPTSNRSSTSAPASAASAASASASPSASGSPSASASPSGSPSPSISPSASESAPPSTAPSASPTGGE